jgi:F-type H+-transporting ATPase subunit epsilon
MANSIRLQVITPSKLFYMGDVEIVIVRTNSGEEGFMANHAWACKLLEIGEMYIKEDGSKEFKMATVSGGFIDVKKDIVIYTDAAEWAEDIDPERAKKAMADTETWLLEHKDDDPADLAVVQDIFTKQRVRVRAATETGRRRGGTKG